PARSGVRHRGRLQVPPRHVASPPARRSGPHSRRRRINRRRSWPTYTAHRVDHRHCGGAMTLWLGSAALLVVGRVAGAQSDSTGVVHVDPEKVAAAIAKGGPLVTRPDLLVSGSHREEAGQVEVDGHETDVLYILDADAPFVSGGKMVGGKMSQPGQWLG